MAQAYDPPAMTRRVAVIREKIENAARAAGRDPKEILLCAVCKTQTPEIVRESAGLPVDLFGENHMQELVCNYDAGAYLNKPCHFIGHLQTNKVKKVVGRAAVIQSVDSLRLLEAIEKEAAKQELTQTVFLEINFEAEESKTGAGPDLLYPLLDKCIDLPHIEVQGLMTIPPLGLDEGGNRRIFARLRDMMEEAKAKGYTSLRHLSMGMTSSFEAAILEGADIVRVGTGIYGPRNYNK